MNLFNLFATLTLDSSEYEQKLNQSEKSAKSFSSGIGTAFKTGARAVAGFAAGVAAVTTAIAGLAVKTIDYAGDLDDNAQRVGMSTEAYQKWAFAMQLAGGDASTLQIAVRGLTTFVDELSTGQGDALLTLQKLGIGYEEFMAMPTEDKLKAIIEGLQGMENQTEMTTIAQDIFGSRAYQTLMPILNQEKGYVDELFASMEDLGLVMSDDAVKAGAALGDQLDILKQKITVVGATMMSDLFPEIELILEGLNGLVSGSDGAMDALSEGLIGLIDKIANALPTIIETAADLLVNIIDGIIKALPSIIPNIVSMLESILLTVIDVIPSLIGQLGNIVSALFTALMNVNWATLITELIDATIEIATVQLPKALGDIITTIFNTFTSPEGLSKILDAGKNIGQALLEGIGNIFVSGMDLIVEGLNAIISPIAGLFGKIVEDFEIPTLSEWIEDTFGEKDDPIREAIGVGNLIAAGGIAGLIPPARFASGGMFPDTGTLYALAGEDGAEIVARGARGTGVANVEQIADAQYMALNDYDLRGAIQQAAAAIVNGIVGGLNYGTQDSGNTPVIIRIGDKDFNGYIVNTVNGTLRAQGRKSLNRVTAYGKR